MDLPLYVLDDPKRRGRHDPDHDHAHSLAHALEVLAETFQHGEGFAAGIAEAPPAVRVDRSNLILRRFLLVSPDEAVGRFDDWFARAPAVVRVGKGSWTGARDDGLDDAVSSQLRRVEGKLRLRWSPVSVPVVLEMLPWYCSRVVLDLRPADLGKRMAWLRRETFFFTAHALLGDLRRYLEVASG